MNAAALAHALGGKRSGRQWKAKCPAHNDREPSLIIFDGREQVQVRCLAGCRQEDLISTLAAMGLWDVCHTNDTAHRQVQRDDGDEGNRNSALAVSIWNDAADPRSTLAEMYLWSRELSLPPDCSTLRFHPCCPRGRDRQPALIAAMCKLGDHEPVAIQRIYLKPDASKDGAMMLGPVGGAAMKLTPHYATFADVLLFCPRLHVCEGLETGLALIQRGYPPVWALGSAGAIERFPVLFAVGSLIIFADNDPVGMSAAMVCTNRWNAVEGRSATICTPGEEGLDFADKVQA
jgi:putative DNA primase/helicase